MRRLLAALLFAATAHAGTPDTINPIPEPGAAFVTDLQKFLREEDAERYGEMHFLSFAVTGGIHSTGSGLSQAPEALIAYPGGWRITEDGAITYPDNDTCWVIANKDTVGNQTTFTRVPGTHYLTDCSSATEPVIPEDATYLMEVTTAAGSVTNVIDKRLTSPIPAFTIPPNTITEVELAPDSVTSIELRDDAVNDSNRAVTKDHIRNNAITTEKITDEAVTDAKLRSDASVDANRAVTGNHIRDNAITSGKIAADSVGSTQIADGSVTSSKLSPGAVVGDSFAASIPKACIYNSAGQNVGAGNTATVNFNSETTDSANMHDNVTNNSRMTFTEAGFYYVQFNGMASSGAKLSGTFRKNGSGGNTLWDVTGPDGASFGTLFIAAVNDYLEVRIYNATGGTLTLSGGENQIRFCAILLGK